MDLVNFITSPGTIAAVAAGIAAVGGLIALVTSVINRETALVNRLAREAASDVTDGRKEPEVLLLSRPERFVDRDQPLLEAMEKMGAGERVLAIEGEPGVGKSALATELAHRLRAERRLAGPDLRAHNFVWIDGQGGCPTLQDICQQIALLTGEQSLTSVADELKLHALRVFFARSRTVLLLDNVVLEPTPAGAALGELMRTLPIHTFVIASINAPHGLEAQRVVLRELEAPHAVELMRLEAMRLGLADSGILDPEVVDRLLKVVGGNPRLIESFVRSFRRRPQSLEELLAEVERGEHARSLLLPMWNDVPETSRQVLAACACLDGQATADQLLVACDLDRAELHASLAELMLAGVVDVVRSAGRPDVYTSPPSVQRIVLAETGAGVAGDLIRRLTSHYVRQLTAEPENAAWVVPHVPAIRAVLRRLYETNEDVELQAVFSATPDVLFTLGLFDDRVSLGRLAYQSATRSGNHRAASLATDVLSSTHAARGELKEAREAVAHGLLAAERCDDPGERARQMRAQALASYKARDAADALAVLAGAEHLAREVGELEIVVNVLGLRTVAHWYLGDLDGAEASARAGLAACEDEEKPWARARAYPLRNLAEVALSRGELSAARALLDEAHEVAAAYGDRRQLTRIRLTRSRAQLFEGRLRLASGDASAAALDALRLGLAPELREARAIRLRAIRAMAFPVLRLYYQRRRPHRFTDAPVGGD